MDTNIGDKDKAELVKFIDDILYFDEAKSGSVIMPFRSFALSEKYQDLGEMEIEVELLVKKLKNISQTAITKSEPHTDPNPDILEVWGVELKFSPDELKQIRSQLAATV